MKEFIREGMEALGYAIVFSFALILGAGLVSWVIYSVFSSVFGVDGLHSTWPESAEFSQLMTGQERFSEHATNVDGLIVVVDHETGVQYLADGHGMTALLSADGTPLLVAEAGS